MSPDEPCLNNRENAKPGGVRSLPEGPGLKSWGLRKVWIILCFCLVQARRKG